MGCPKHFNPPSDWIEEWDLVIIHYARYLTLADKAGICRR